MNLTIPYLDLNTIKTASILVLLGLTAIYLFAFFLHKKKYFVFMGSAWFANLIYILIENEDKKNLQNALIIYLISLISTYLMFFAYLALRTFSKKNIKEKKQLNRKYLLRVLSPWSVFIALGIIISSLPQNFSVSFLILVTPGLIFATYLLIALSLFFLKMSRLDLLGVLGVDVKSVSEIYSHEQSLERIRMDYKLTISDQNYQKNQSVKNKDIIPFRVRKHLSVAKACFYSSFGIYGLMQLTYILKPSEFGTLLFNTFFLLALFLKIFNGIGILFLAIADIRCSENAIRINIEMTEMEYMLLNVEHGIKGPLSSIDKKIDLIKEKYQHDNLLLNHINKVSSNVDLIYSSANRIVALKETKSFYENNSKILNIIPIIKKAREMVKNKFEGRTVDIYFKKYPSIVNVKGRGNRLVEAISNILTNGAEACFRKDGLKRAIIEIEVILKEEREETEIHITDHGEGISDEDIKNILYFGVSSKDINKVTNRGIGLYVANDFISKHEGSIHFDSEVGDHTRVTITLPTHPKKKKGET